MSSDTTRTCTAALRAWRSLIAHGTPDAAGRVASERGRIIPRARLSSNNATQNALWKPQMMCARNLAKGRTEGEACGSGDDELLMSCDVTVMTLTVSTSYSRCMTACPSDKRLQEAEAKASAQAQGRGRQTDRMAD